MLPWKTYWLQANIDFVTLKLMDIQKLNIPFLSKYFVIADFVMIPTKFDQTFVTSSYT